MTKAQVKKLIATYVNAHKNQLQGPAGPAGANGTPGQTGPAGPGAIPIVAGAISPASESAGTAGPWSFTLSCTGTGADLTIHGPGTVGGTTSLSEESNPATTSVLGASAIGTGADFVADKNEQRSATLFLRSESTVYELNTLVTAVNGGLFTQCAVVGDAIPGS